MWWSIVDEHQDLAALFSNHFVQRFKLRPSSAPVFPPKHRGFEAVPMNKGSMASVPVAFVVSATVILFLFFFVPGTRCRVMDRWGERQ
ncbi:hypothetical protein Ae201684P_017390 [Aphanomyces euteiches]|nr:hypothetical protein Ae201684P_017390 [Aphanomyces euteiches]